MLVVNTRLIRIPPILDQPADLGEAVCNAKVDDNVDDDDSDDENIDDNDEMDDNIGDNDP